METGMSEDEFAKEFSGHLEHMRIRRSEILLETGRINESIAIAALSIPFSPVCGRDHPDYGKLADKRREFLDSIKKAPQTN